MDQLKFRTYKELLGFFSKNKTAMSCIENPNIFLSQLRDNKLVSEDLYQEVIKMRIKKTKQSGVYKILEGVEKMGGQSVKLFWSCVFKDHIQKSYPIFDTLQKELLGSSSRAKQPSAGQPSRNNEAERQKKVVTKRKREESDQGIDKAKPGTSFWSSQMNPAKKSTPSLLHERETLTVTCNKKKGVLYPAKLATGDKCICSETQWFSPPEFEAFSGLERSKNWKTSIRYRKTPLQKFIKDGRLKCKRYYRGRAREQKQPVPSRRGGATAHTDTKPTFTVNFNTSMDKFFT